MKRTHNKSALVKEHLIQHGNITSWEAIQEYGATRLSSIIFNLRKAGYDIITQDIITQDIAFTDRFGNSGTYAKYVLIGGLNASTGD